MYDITSLGESLIDFTESGVSDSGNRLFEQNPGGAVANVLCAAAKFGKKTAFIGKVGDDMHGAFIKETLNRAGVDTKGLIQSPDVFTTLAFVALRPSGERSFSFARKPGADTCLEISELDDNILKNTRVLHVGSLSLTHEPARSATYEAVRRAKESGAIISYDPNYRASLWSDVETASKLMRSLVPMADVIKISDEEISLLTGSDDVEEAMDILEAQGVKIIAVTLGSKGAKVRIKGETGYSPVIDVPVVDTTGAGDSFWGGFLTCLLSGNIPLDKLTLKEVLPYIDFGNAVATCCIQKRGAIPAMPSTDDIKKLFGDELLKLI